MKLLIYIFIISLSYALSDIIDDDAAKKIVVKTFPKKVKPSLYQINNSGKYIKPKPLPTKKPHAAKDYTVFAKIQQTNHAEANIPDSPYFEIDKQQAENKPRVKKVLPEYTWHSRSKRSVVTKEDEKKKAPAKPVVNKGNKTQKLNGNPKKIAKRTNRKMKRQRKQGMRKGRQLRQRRQRNGPIKNRKLKYTKARPRDARYNKLRTKFGEKQAKKILSDRRNFLNNMSKPTQKGARRLIAARDALIEDYPYVISIQKERQHWCAGALLNPRLAITTANCLWKSNRVSHMHIRAGSRHTDRGGQVANIQEVMKHPGWKIRRNPDNDVALVLLDRNLKFSDRLHGVDLPNRIMMPAFEDAWITSWGSERRDGVFDSKSDTLQVHHVRVMDRQKCNNVTQRFGVTVTENFICLAQTGMRAPCTRDTGAPAVSDGVLWGLASWGIRKLCGTERFPAMYSYLGSETNLNFIINATHYLMADQRFYPYPDKMPF